MFAICDICCGEHKNLHMETRNIPLLTSDNSVTLNSNELDPKKIFIKVCEISNDIRYISIIPNGKWKDLLTECDADGYDGSCLQPSSLLRCPSTKYFTMMGVFANSISQNDYNKNLDKKAFKINKNSTKIAVPENDKTLYIFANDVPYFYLNNFNIDMSVTVQSIPSL